MKKNKKQNEITTLCSMASIISDNISALESVFSKNNHTLYLYTDTLFFELLQTTDKSYFTSIEKEDIFLIACNIQNLNDEIRLLKETINTDYFSNTEKLKRQINQLKDLFDYCSIMLRDLENLQKRNDMTIHYQNFRTYAYKTTNTTENTILNKCKNYCNKIAGSIYFSYLKNT